MRVVKIIILLISFSFGFYSHTAAFTNSVIDTMYDVNLNGVNQKILVQSKNLNNPILLWLHGGPGTSEMFITHYCMNELPEYFTIVHWDQRGTALSFSKSIKSSDISFDKIFDDANKLTEYLKEKYHQKKIFIIGHSFGSILGIHLIDKYPDNYYAYIGIGQVVDEKKSNEITYEWFVKKLKEKNDNLELSKLRKTKTVSRDLINKYRGIFWKEKRLMDVIKESPYYYKEYHDIYMESMKFVRMALSKNRSIHEKNILKDILKLKVPAYFFEGKHDRIAACAPELVVEYNNKLKAAKHEIVWFDESAHHPNIDEPNKFQNMLIDKILKENYKKN